MSDQKEDIKIVDRRRFDESGNQRTAADKPSASSKQAPQEPTGIDFSSFVVSLATQALMQLGEMPPPQGVDIKKDVDAARQSIDIIDMLRVKTQGNLDATETRLVDDILHNLRLSYVKAAKG